MTWDAAGNRITFQSSTRTNDTDTYTFVYDPTAGVPAVIEEISPTGSVVKYIRGPGGNLIAHITGSGETEAIQYYHFDEQGSVIFLTSSTGDVTDKYTYDDWGNATHVGTTDQPYQYIGAFGYYTHHQDSNLKQMQLGFRFYAPKIGRFTQLDPIGDGLNWYAYCGGDPKNGVDPWGLARRVSGGPDGGFARFAWGFGGAFNGMVKGAYKMGVGLLALMNPLTALEPADHLSRYIVQNGYRATGKMLWNGFLGSIDFWSYDDPEMFGERAFNIVMLGTALYKTGAAVGSKIASMGKSAECASSSNPILGKPRIGSALKNDIAAPGTAKAHGFPDFIDDYANEAQSFQLNNGAVLYQVEGSYNGVSGRFEWIVQNGSVTHRMFVRGPVNGIPIK